MGGQIQDARPDTRPNTTTDQGTVKPIEHPTSTPRIVTFQDENNEPDNQDHESSIKF